MINWMDRNFISRKANVFKNIKPSKDLEGIQRRVKSKKKKEKVKDYRYKEKLGLTIRKKKER